ncbi:hypothetical protein V1514DRAFT_338427 [Lipomyces japonicus]|uniref:uncharacterized protein n=1 Tax=Lipomyces japonicus TaxID=56871 RepID=UPI0034CED90E
MKFFTVIVSIFALAFASLVAAELDARAYVTVTTLETITSCAPTVTQCVKTKTSVFTPPAVTSSIFYHNSSTTLTSSYPHHNATNTTTPPIHTFTGAANAVRGSAVVPVVAGVVGVLAFAL